MNATTLAAREITANDIPYITRYWLESDKDFLVGMGVDLAKLPGKEDLEKMLAQQLSQSYPEKKAYSTIWLIDGQPVGHCNVNKIIFGEEASMHLHLWNTLTRQKGAGAQLVKLSLPYFFNNLQLKKLYCEPYALNAAPNKTLPKAGFTFIKEYITTPGTLNFEQPVNRWELTLANFQQLV